MRLLPLAVLLAAAVVVHAADVAGCFNTLLYATPAAVDVAVPVVCAGVWRMHTRTVYAAQADDAAAQAVLVAAYADEPGVVRLERFRTDSGALIDSVPLASPPAAIRAACVTAYDVWAAAADGTLVHWDAVSGQRRPAVAHAAVAASAQVWLACSPTRLWISVPAARSVWQLAVEDGRIEHVVARLASPGVLAVDADRRLWIVDGRPGITAWVVDVSNATQAAPFGLYATPLTTDGALFTSAVTRNDGAAALLLAADGRMHGVAAAGAAQPVDLGMPTTPYARLLASPALAVRGAGALVDVHDGAEHTPHASPLNNEGNVAALAYRPVAVGPSQLLAIDAAGDVVRLEARPLNVSSPCAEAALAYVERAVPLAASGGAGVRVLDVALDGTVVWVDAATGLVRVRLAPDGSADRVLPTLLAPAGAQVRAVGGANAAACALFDRTIECRDLATDLASPTFTAPDVEELVMQWDGDAAIVLFGVTGSAELDVWRIEAPLAAGAALEWRCALRLGHTGLQRSAAYWGVAPVGDGGFLVRWSATDALFVDANCSLRAHIDELRADAQPTLAYVAGTDAPLLCVGTNAPRPVRLPVRGIAGWMVVGVLLCACGVGGLVLGAVCMAAPRRVWRNYAMRGGGGGAAWTRFGTGKRRRLRSLCALDHDMQTSIYTVLSWLCPCVADAAHAYMQRWWTPVVFEGTADAISTNSAPISLVDASMQQSVATLLAEPDDPRWAEIDTGFSELAKRSAAAAAAVAGTE